MRADRPQNLLALAVASLALALAVWWAFETFTESPATEPSDKTADLPPTWLEPDPIPKEPGPLPKREARPEPGPELRPPPPPAEAPPERIQPDVMQPPDEEAGDPEPAFLPPDEGEEEEAPLPDFHTDAFRTRLLGGVARVNARATPSVRVPEGTAVIGSPLDYVRGLVNAARVSEYVGLLMEAPVHHVRLEEFFFDRFETRNHQYLSYLNATARILYNTSRHKRRKLSEIVEYLIPERPANLDVGEVTARQLFWANRLALLSAWKGLVVKDRDGVIDVDKTYERVRDRDVPRGVRLVFYDRLPPGTWPGAVYDAQRGDYPVRDISMEEAIEYALFRGRHIPTEQQWEYAARGPKGLRFPWDSRGRGFATHVNGGRPLRRGVEPETKPVTHHPGGTSWIGVFNMLGNVSEWTSSYLDVYPGGVQAPGVVPGANLVVRGGSVNDREPWDVRSSMRAWRADDPAGAPAPGQRRRWTGIRTARWEEPGQSRLPAMHYRARAHTRIDPALLEPRLFEGWAGAQAEVFERVAGEDNRDKPPAGVKSLVAQGLRVAAASARGRGAVALPFPLVEDVETLIARSSVTPVLLGLFHTDMHVLDVYGDSQRGGFYGGRVPARMRRTDMRPGTYFVALMQGFVAFLRTDLREAYYPLNRPVKAATLNVLEQDYPAGAVRLPIVKLTFDGRTRAELHLLVPLSLSASPSYAASLRLRLKLDSRETRLVPKFERGRITRPFLR